MKILALSIALLSSSFIVSANPYYPNNSNGFTTPNFNWGNNNNGSNWNMPNMNWGNGYNNGSSWNMPSFNWGSGNRGNNWSMPSMNWGNNNGYGSGSNWSMPSMNWGNNNAYGSGSNWSMPNMNWGNSYNGGNSWNNNSRPWNFGNGRYNGASAPGYRFVPNPAYPAPMPQFKAQTLPKLSPPKMKVQSPKAPVPAVQSAPKVIAPIAKEPTLPTLNDIPKPSEVKGVIVTPENKSKVSAEIGTPAK